MRNRSKTLLKTLLATTITAAFVLTGCGKTETKAEAVEFTNKAEISDAYEMTALVSVPSSNISNNAVQKTGDNGEVKVEDCGKLNTVNETYNLPTITAGEDVTYFSPVIGNVEVKSVKYVKAVDESKTEEDSKGFVEETKVKVGDKETKAFLIKHSGVYEAEIGDEKITLTVKEGSLFDDMINGTTAKNVMVNKDSKEVADRTAEYDNALPLLVQSYLEKYKTQEEALNALKSENAALLKEYNRIRVLKGEEPLSISDIVTTFKDKTVEESTANAAPNKRGIVAKATEIKASVEANAKQEQTEASAKQAQATANASNNASNAGANNGGKKHITIEEAANMWLYRNSFVTVNGVEYYIYPNGNYELASERRAKEQKEHEDAERRHQETLSSIAARNAAENQGAEESSTTP